MLNLEAVLWDLPWGEYRLWQAACLGTGSFAHYHERLNKDVARAYAEGRPVTLLRVSVAEVLREVRALGLEECAESVPHALLSLYGRQVEHGTPALPTARSTPDSRDSDS